MKIQALRCTECGDIVYSRARHDMRWCSCKSVAADGGFDYQRVAFKSTPPENVEVEVEATKNELFRDWNRSEDRFGVIHSSTEKNT